MNINIMYLSRATIRSMCQDKWDLNPNATPTGSKYQYRLPLHPLLKEINHGGSHIIMNSIARHTIINMNSSKHIIINGYEDPNTHNEKINAGNKNTPIKFATTCLMDLRESKFERLQTRTDRLHPQLRR